MKIDWKLLKKQKETLCNVIHDNRHNEMISGDLDGILYLIDALQDELEPKEKEEQETYSPQEGEKFARKCDVTGEGMDEGYCVQDGDFYIKYKKDLIEHLRKLDWEDENGYKSKDVEDDDELMDFFTEQEYYYWTQWENTQDNEYIFTNGQLVEIELIESLKEQEEQETKVSNYNDYSWRFVEKYFPNYNSSNFILRANDLQKIIDNEAEEESIAFLLFKHEFNEDMEKVKISNNEILIFIYEQAISNFIEINGGI